MIVATCLHELKSFDDAIEVMYGDKTLDFDRGFIPCVVTVTYCRKCASEAVMWPYFIKAEKP